jgi:hypothetical protein
MRLYVDLIISSRQKGLLILQIFADVFILNQIVLKNEFMKHQSRFSSNKHMEEDI